MCVLFVKFLKSAKPGEFKLILASNRDELFKRPGKTAHFWEEDDNIFGGRDMTEEKEGGTWLAMSKKGRIGVLLNASGAPNPRKLGRGFLVPDFLKTSLTDKEYLEEVIKSREKYNSFHLVTADLGPKSMLHYSNATDSPDITEVTDGIFAVGNSSLKAPFQKVLRGKEKFHGICNRSGMVERKEELVSDLLQFLKWEEKHYPDEVIDGMSHIPCPFKPNYGAVFVKSPDLSYGTRTHTVILVDWKNRVDFYEWTLKDPITPEHMEWYKTHQKFDITADSF
ncbi:hypothetical protein RUM44_012227 [Polyplax serrata]|uniref:Transport and Golgi organization protein 2 homolog n=1 Tax=Polyplax serrata TaxID=468196 RepID=A0ABR1BAP6_POLSC